MAYARYMEENDSMNKKPYSIEELNTRLDRVNGWINNCDQKASILLAFAAALAAVLLTSDIMKDGYDYLITPFYKYWLKDVPSEVSYKKLIVILLLLPLAWNVINMIKFLILVLRPKTIIADFQEERSLITKNSRLHFQSIAGKMYNDFLLDCQNQSEESYLNDLCSQIYCNSRICNDKFENYKKGLRHFVCTLKYIGIEILVLFLLP